MFRFVDNVALSYNGMNGPESKTTRMFCLVLQASCFRYFSLVVPCDRLSWLPGSFLAHAKCIIYLAGQDYGTDILGICATSSFHVEEAYERWLLNILNTHWPIYH